MLPVGYGVITAEIDGRVMVTTGELQREMVEGPAGAGKTELLKKYREGMEQAGKPEPWLASPASGTLP